jgi:hypothetical protein
MAVPNRTTSDPNSSADINELQNQITTINSQSWIKNGLTTFVSTVLFNNIAVNNYGTFRVESSAGEHSYQYANLGGVLNAWHTSIRTDVGGANNDWKLLRFNGSGSFQDIPLQVTQAGGGVLLGASAPATNATDGFVYIPVSTNSPTGTPTSQSGRVPMVYDSANDLLWIYRGGWKKSAFTA